MNKRKGRKPAENPLTERALVRLTPQDTEELRDECRRLSERTGQRWTISGYLRMAGRAHKGKHLP